MLYFLFLTRKCNLSCIYCGGKTNPTTSISSEITYSFSELEEFLNKDSDPIIVFYGGEPLLRISLLELIMDEIEKADFIIQTNGILLDRIDPSYLKRIKAILISIDGSEKITDFYRGESTFRKIRQNMKIVRKNGYLGDLIARMTVSFNSEIYRDVSALINLKYPSFDYIHWQIDVIWSNMDRWINFNGWVDESYNRGITNLITDWKDKIEETQKVQGIVPFMGIMKTLFSESAARLHCRAGIDAFAIQTNGEIYACPVSPEFDDFKVGNIKLNHPKDIQESLLIQEPCVECDVYTICGGRCLFANRHNFWKDDFFSVCDTIKHLIHELKRIKPSIETMIEEGKITQDLFDLPSFNHSMEIIP